MNDRQINLEISKLAIQGLDLLGTAREIQESLGLEDSKDDTTSLLDEYSEPGVSHAIFWSIKFGRRHLK